MDEERRKRYWHTILKYAGLSLAGIALFLAASAAAYRERGYRAVGGEAVLLLLPILYWMASGTAKEALDIFRGGPPACMGGTREESGAKEGGNRMRVYISGPVTGQEDTAGRRFSTAVLEVLDAAKEAGAVQSPEFINPYDANQKMTYGLDKKTVAHADYMTVSLAMLSICDVIYMMRGWEKSKGCLEEYRYAMEHGYKIFYQDGSTVISKVVS